MSKKPKLEKGSLERCFPPLRKLIEKHGGDRDLVAKLVGIGRGYVDQIVWGNNTPSQKIAQRIQDALDGKPVDLKSEGPKPKSVKVAPKKHKAINLDKLPKSCPPLLAKLIKREGGKTQAARALGYTFATWVTKRAYGQQEFTAADAAKVKATLKGATPKPVENVKPDEQGFGQETGELGLAVVLSKSANIQALIDAGVALEGSCCFKRRLGTNWLVIIKLDTEKLAAYKAIAGLVATVVTP